MRLPFCRAWRSGSFCGAEGNSLDNVIAIVPVTTDNVRRSRFAMRDDLHKKAPIPRKAQKVLKLALREANRNYPERLRSAAYDALQQFVQNNFSTGILRSLADKQGDFFSWMPSSSQANSP